MSFENILQLAKIASFTKPAELSDKEWSDFLSKASSENSDVHFKRDMTTIAPELIHKSEFFKAIEQQNAGTEVELPLARIKAEQQFNKAILNLARDLESIATGDFGLNLVTHQELKILLEVLDATETNPSATVWAKRTRVRLAQTISLISEDISGLHAHLKEISEIHQKLKDDVKDTASQLTLHTISAFNMIGDLNSLIEILRQTGKEARIRMFNHTDFKSKWQDLDLNEIRDTLRSKSSKFELSAPLLIFSKNENWEIISQPLMRQQIAQMSISLIHVKNLFMAIPCKKIPELLTIQSITDSLEKEIDIVLAIAIFREISKDKHMFYFIKFIQQHQSIPGITAASIGLLIQLLAFMSADVQKLMAPYLLACEDPVLSLNDLRQLPRLLNMIENKTLAAGIKKHFLSKVAGFLLNENHNADYLDSILNEIDAEDRLYFLNEYEKYENENNAHPDKKNIFKINFNNFGKYLILFPAKDQQRFIQKPSVQHFLNQAAFNPSQHINAENISLFTKELEKIKSNATISTNDKLQNIADLIAITQPFIKHEQTSWTWGWYKPHQSSWACDWSIVKSRWKTEQNNAITTAFSYLKEMYDEHISKNQKYEATQLLKTWTNHPLFINIPDLELKLKQNNFSLHSASAC